MRMNPILTTDSYKLSHYKMLPPGASRLASYIEARKGPWDETVFFGLQAYLKTVLSQRVTDQDVEFARDIAMTHMNTELFVDGLQRIIDEYDGYWPVTISALPEGTVAPLGTPQVQIICEPGFAWVTSFIETSLLRAIWYPSTVATLSREIKKIIYDGLLVTSDDPDGQLPFKLHDFGARGASSGESAMLGGMGHLVNFLGTDTLEAIYGAKMLYHEPMAGFSVPASEHSTITSWGRDGETAAYENILDQFPTGLVSCVSDSYDIMNATEVIWGHDLREKVLARDGTLVIRPDSGDPTRVPLDVIDSAMHLFGYAVNSKGFRVMNPKVRVIQGDGMNVESIKKLIRNAIDRRVSLDNFVMGMGGGLLQSVTRDTLSYAMKANEVEIAGEWHDVYKDPATDKTKRSKMGRQAVVSIDGVLTAMRESTLFTKGIDQRANLMRTVWKNGELLVDDTFENIRTRAVL